MTIASRTKELKNALEDIAERVLDDHETTASQLEDELSEQFDDMTEAQQEGAQGEALEERRERLTSAYDLIGDAMNTLREAADELALS
tara:strand:- start:911 stop:1174 length:264 start_codon:yes stop_codon:yes gene_type:complete